MTESVDSNVEDVVTKAMNELEKHCREARTPDASVPRGVPVDTATKVFSNHASNDPFLEGRKKDVLSRMFNAIAQTYEERPADGIVTWEDLEENLNQIVINEEEDVLVKDIRRK